MLNNNQNIFDFSQTTDAVGHVEQINYRDAKYLILNVHYAKRMPSISYAFGLFKDGKLQGVCTFGSPASHFLCIGVCGVEHQSKVLELNRLVLTDNKKNQASFLIAKSLKLLPKPKIIVSYADSLQNHTGIIYQASNFLFTGTTKERTDIASEKNRHSRHHSGDLKKRVKRSSKHRYVYFLGNKKQKSELRNALKYCVLQYPKSNKIAMGF